MTRVEQKRVFSPYQGRKDITVRNVIPICSCVQTDRRTSQKSLSTQVPITGWILGRKKHLGKEISKFFSLYEGRLISSRNCFITEI